MNITDSTDSTEFTLGIINYNFPDKDKKISIKNYLMFPGEELNKIFINGVSCFFQSKTKDDFTDDIIEKMRDKLYYFILNELKIKQDELIKEKKYFNTFFKKEIRIKKLKNITNG